MNCETKDFFSIHRLFPLAVLPLLLYSFILRGEFVYDDVAITVVENPALTGETSMLEVLSWDRPLREFTYMLDHALWGYNPIGYHLQNIAWHSANALMVYFLLGMMGVSTSTAFWAALIFCVHPINVESTAWISGRKEQLCLFFELVSCACFVAALQNHQRVHRIAYAASVLALVLALLSKQVAAAAPLLMAASFIAYRRIRLEKINWQRLALAIAPMFVIVIGFVLFDFGLFSRIQHELEVGSYFDPGARDVSYSFLSALLTPMATFGRSAWLCLVPLDLTIEHAYAPVQSLLDFRWMLGGAALAAAVAGCACAYKRRPEISFALFWFIAAWAPVSGALPISYLIADRYLYIPCVGFSLLIALSLAKLFQKIERGPALALGVVAILFSAQTVNRSLDWRNEIALWKSAVDSRPEHAPAWAALGSAYHRKDINDLAFESWERALSLDPNQPQVWLNRGRAESQRGDVGAAERDYRKALEVAPHYGTAYYNLAALIEKKGDIPRALEYFRLAAKYLTGKRNAERRQGLALYQVARLLFRQGELEAANMHLSRAEMLTPLYAPLYNLKGMILNNDPDAARAAFQQAIDLDPLYGEAYYNLGVLEWTQGNAHQAESYWNRAVDSIPSLQSAIDAIKKNSPKNRE